MTTIPIEVIVQDVETPVEPTPTPETNSTEESIAAPDTGAGTIGNSAFSSSSIAGIIVPVVLLVLALATVCTLLIHRHHKRQDSKASKKEKLAASISTIIVVLSATVLLSNLVLPATKAATSDPEVDIQVPDKISIVANREDDTAEATTGATAYITSTATFGYKVLLSMAEGVETSNLYLGGDTTSEYYIAPVEEGTLEANTWGYMLSDEEAYSAVPLVDDAALALKGYNNVVDKETTIDYGVRVDKDLPAGTYMGEIEYVTGNAIEYMQDFATLTTEEKSSVLTSMAEDQQYYLKDNRDNKTYHIAKLKDGNLWMTQNLDLDLDKNKTLTPADTDIAENWTPSSTTINFTGTTVDGWVNSNSTPYSANPEELYIYPSSDTGADGWYGSLEACKQIHPDCTMRNHVGNYYNWSAAVAASDPSEITGEYKDAPSSICPAGWRLPTSIRSSSDIVKNNEQFAMVSSYNEILENSGSGCGGDCKYYAYQNNGFNIIRTAPLWLVRSGEIVSDQISDSSGGYYWSSTSGDTTLACGLSFNSYATYISAYGTRGIGQSIRCLVR